jgi:hypothetical protein
VTLTIDEKTQAAIEQLQEGLGAKSLPEVIQRALGLAKLAVDRANPETGTVTLGDDSIDLKK